jgi:hypothetical protein
MKEDYHLTNNEDLSAFLGIQIEKKCIPTGGQEFHLTQPALIKKICATVPLLDQCIHGMPTNKVFYKGSKHHKAANKALYKGSKPHKTDFLCSLQVCY